jgi:dihydroflavonol-4-reductase
MTTLLTGASGFIGSWIARTLSPAPGSLRALVLPGSNLSALNGLSFEIVEGDLLDPASLRRALEGVSQVYHAAGLISFRPRDAETVRRVNFEGAVNLFEAALRAGVTRMVYTASIFAVGQAASPERLVHEDSEFNAGNLLDIPYIGAKRDAELAAQAYIDKGLPLIRLYPGLCLGTGDVNRSSSGAIDAWLHGQLPGITTGGGICMMDVRDAAAAHIAAMEKGVPGRRYLATGHNITLTGLFERLSRITGKPAPLLRLPPSLGIPAARLTERLGIFPALDSAQARLMARHWWYDSTRAQKELGISFRPLDDTLKEAVDWLRANRT